MNYYYPPFPAPSHPDMYPQHFLPEYAPSLPPPVPPPPNRYIYVNNNFNVPFPAAPKVLVNPHFKKKVFVNPLFNPPKIHVNPDRLKQQLQLAEQEPPMKTTTVINTRNKLVRVPNNELDQKNNVCRTVIKTRNKIVRVANEQSVRRKRTSIINSPMPKRRRSLQSKYKIVRTSTTPKRRSNVLVTKYKLSKITPPSARKPLESMKKTPKRKFFYVNNFLSMSLMAKNVVLKQNRRLHSASFININGILYKNSPTSLMKAASSKTPTKSNLNVTSTSSKSSSRYKMVRKVVKMTSRGGALQNRSLVKKYKIIRTRRNVNNLKKCNIPCQIYRRTGKCKAKEEGKCNRVHNPKQIVLCTRFLQGACTNDSCPLSHKVSQEKMPTCKFFLDGLCSKDDCQYLHVKISPKADICRDFLAGFCERGAQCDKRHQFLCPDYEKGKSCPKKRCPYPHGVAVRNTKVFKRVVAKKCSKQAVSKKCDSKSAQGLGELDNQRYYQDRLESDVDADKNVPAKGKNRPKLGILPVFIPFFETS